MSEAVEYRMRAGERTRFCGRCEESYATEQCYCGRVHEGETEGWHVKRPAEVRHPQYVCQTCAWAIEDDSVIVHDSTSGAAMHGDCEP
jgi:hypothetical protein